MHKTLFNPHGGTSALYLSLILLYPYSSKRCGLKALECDVNRAGTAIRVLHINYQGDRMIPIPAFGDVSTLDQPSNRIPALLLPLFKLRCGHNALERVRLSFELHL